MKGNFKGKSYHLKSQSFSVFWHEKFKSQSCCILSTFLHHIHFYFKKIIAVLILHYSVLPSVFLMALKIASWNTKSHKMFCISSFWKQLNLLIHHEEAHTENLKNIKVKEVNGAILWSCMLFEVKVYVKQTICISWIFHLNNYKSFCILTLLRLAKWNISHPYFALKCHVLNFVWKNIKISSNEELKRPQRVGYIMFRKLTFTFLLNKTAAVSITTSPSANTSLKSWTS